MAKQQKKAIAVTPVIRAKTSADAFVSTGHNHDIRYIRYDAAQAGMSSSEINQFLTNANSAIATDAKLVRTDIIQSLAVANKDQARENIGIIDDLNIADVLGNFNTSDFASKLAGAAPTNNDLLEHFVRFDVSQTLDNTEKQQLTDNIEAFSLLTGLSEQTIDSSIRFEGAGFVLTGGKATLSAGATLSGTPLNDTTATVHIASPNSETAIIKIVAGTAAATTVAMDCSAKEIINQKDPTAAQSGATKNYVDTQILAQDLDSEYIRTDGNNSFGASPNFGNNKGINASNPTASNDVANKTYVDSAANISTAITSSAGAGLTTIQSITPTTVGKYLVMLSGKITSGTVHTLLIKQGAATIETRYLNTDGAGQWSITIPISISVTTAVSITPPSGVAINQFDLMKFGY